jgi:hypothetical protein
VTLPRLRATLVGVIGATAAIVAAACSSSTTSGPPVTIGELALHYDQLAGNYLAGNAGSDPAIGQAIEVLNGPMADGVFPNPAQVIGSNISKGWFGNSANLVDSAGTDSVQIVSLWFGGTATAVLQLIYHNAQFSAAFVTDSGGNTLQDSVGAATGSFTPTTGTCTFTTITHISTQFPTFAPTTSACTTAGATFAADSLKFPTSDSSNTRSLNNLRILSQHVGGVRLQFDHAADFSQHVSQPLAKALQRR